MTVKKIQIPDLPGHETSRISLTSDTSKTQTNKRVILNNLTGESDTSNFNNPMKLADALYKLIFKKYIMEDTLRVLRKSKTIRFELSSLTKLPPFNQTEYKVSTTCIK